MSSKSNKILLILIIIIALLCCLYIFNRTYTQNNHRRISWPSYFMTHSRRPATLSDVSYISSWMTFDYINKVFGLPPTYLQQDLGVQNAKYPFITLSQYAKTTNASTRVIIGDVQNILRQYLIASSTQIQPAQ